MKQQCETHAIGEGPNVFSRSEEKIISNWLFVQLKFSHSQDQQHYTDQDLLGY